MEKPSVSVTVRQLKAARALLRWSQRDLAEASGISAPAIERIEMQEGELAAHASTVQKLVDALQEAGVTFDLDQGTGPGVRLIRPA
jgi:predicted transcriptional regulator